MLSPKGPCGNCGNDTFEITVTRVDKITLDLHGDVDDKDGSDSVSDLNCASCGGVAPRSADLTGDQIATVFWEVERQVLET